VFIRAVSNPTDVDTPGTPQNLAADWLINEDSLYVCPQDPFLLQRYAMAVFYYSTRGDRWSECSAPSNFTDPASIELANESCTIAVPGTGMGAWLTPVSECDWAAVACDNSTAVIRIDFGTFSWIGLFEVLILGDFVTNQLVVYLCRTKWNCWNFTI
jgi:hypothetical protein